MLPESKMIDHMHEAFMAFVIILERLHQLLEKPDLDVGIVHIKLFVFAYFGGDHALVWIFVVNTFYDLSEGALVNWPDDLVSVANLLTLFY